MQFHSLIGHKETRDQLVKMIRQNRLGHALLFLGKEGSGALQLAMAFAQYVICEKANGRPVTGTTTPAGPSLFGDEPAPAPVEAPVLEDSCGTCAACQKAGKFVHPDIHYCYPVIPQKPGDKPICTDFIVQWRSFMAENPYGNVFDWLQYIGAENRQGNITAEECNDIIRKLSLKSFESEYKILIIWMPEYLSKNGNRLLKLIEEPPPNTLFILVAEDEAQILPTILSRTQLVKVPLLSNLEVEAALELHAGVPLEKASGIARLAEGNYREALLLLQHADDDWHEKLRDWLNLVVRQNFAGQLKWIDDMAKLGREKQKQFLRYFIHLLEDCLRIRLIETGVPNPPAVTEFALKFNKLCSVWQQEAMVRELEQATYYIERNAHAKMLFHALTIKLFHIICNNSLILVN